MKMQLYAKRNRCNPIFEICRSIEIKSFIILLQNRIFGAVIDFLMSVLSSIEQLINTKD